MWFQLGINAVGFGSLIAGLISIPLLRKGMTRNLVIGMGIGYVLFGLVFTIDHVLDLFGLAVAVCLQNRNGLMGLHRYQGKGGRPLHLQVGVAQQVLQRLHDPFTLGLFQALEVDI